MPHVQEHQRSAHNTEAYLRKRILPALGKKALDEVTQADVAELRRKLVAEGLAAGTVNRHLACVYREADQIAPEAQARLQVGDQQLQCKLRPGLNHVPSHTVLMGPMVASFLLPVHQSQPARDAPGVNSPPAARPRWAPEMA